MSAVIQYNKLTGVCCLMNRLLILCVCITCLIAGCAAQTPAVQPAVNPLPTVIPSTVTPETNPADVPAVPIAAPEPSPSVTPEPSAAPAPVIPKTETEIEALLSEVFHYSGLVDMEELNAGFVFSITYATEDNFTGRQLYDKPLSLASDPLAEALLRAQAKADEYGYRLLIYDIYRPTDVQRLMYELTPANLKKFVAKPGPNANHTKGVAVDCTLADLDGQPLPMPSEYDEFTARASASYAGGTEEERMNRDLLISIMQDCGLRVASGEWWHFALNGASQYPVLDITFEEFVMAREDEVRQ